MQCKECLHPLALESGVTCELCIVTCRCCPFLERIKDSTQQNTFLPAHVVKIQLNQDHLPCDPIHVLWFGSICFTTSSNTLSYIYCKHFIHATYSSWTTLKSGAVSSSEMLVTNYHMTQHHIQKDFHHHQQCCDSLKSQSRINWRCFSTDMYQFTNTTGHHPEPVESSTHSLPLSLGSILTTIACMHPCLPSWFYLQVSQLNVCVQLSRVPFTLLPFWLQHQLHTLMVFNKYQLWRCSQHQISIQLLCSFSLFNPITLLDI